MLLERLVGVGVYWFVGGGVVDSWPLSVHTRLCLDNERQTGREKDRGRKETRVGEKKRERDGLYQGLLRA